MSIEKDNKERMKLWTNCKCKKTEEEEETRENNEQIEKEKE